MKKTLLLTLIGLLLILAVYIVIFGFEAGTVEVLSYVGIQEKNQELDARIQESSKLVEKDYRQAVSNVQETGKKLEQTRKEYEDMVVVSPDGNTQPGGQIERYEIETLWVKLGNYATSEGAIIRMDILQGNVAGSYNLKFTVNGSYISITDFISDIENDSTLGFKIEEFKMVPSGNDLQATFICNDIAIKQVSATSNPDIGLPQNDTNNTNNSNTTNNGTSGTNSNNTINSTTTGNTTNTTSNTTNSMGNSGMSGIQ